MRRIIPHQTFSTAAFFGLGSMHGTDRPLSTPGDIQPSSTTMDWVEESITPVRRALRFTLCLYLSPCITGMPIGLNEKSSTN